VTVDREIDYTLEENEIRVLAAIDAALKRIDEAPTGAASAAARRWRRRGSRRFPWATLCIDDKRRRRGGAERNPWNAASRSVPWRRNGRVPRHLGRRALAVCRAAPVDRPSRSSRSSPWPPDQITKHVVASSIALDHAVKLFGPFSIHHVQNSGIAFGLFSRATIVVIVLTTVAVAWMLVFFARSGARHPALPRRTRPAERRQRLEPRRPRAAGLRHRLPRPALVARLQPGGLRRSSSASPSSSGRCCSRTAAPPRS